ncbi:MAG: DUF5989 family protein [Candidatus Omnitrophica bacterium]|nr:DUF5989 family protein [Candidatus Omnitrophota bacterium]MDD5080124.1 DUF5989 family protein [Candidatus Omnitrophota bacterium]
MVKAVSRFSILGELFGFLWLNRLWWMIPFVAVLVILGLLVLLVQSSAVVPFIYTLF